MGYFTGMVAAITGAGSGIGRSLAVGLAREGCALSLSDVQRDGLDETVAMCTEITKRFGSKITSAIVDVADKDAVYAWCDKTVEEHDGAHIIINNAGVALVDSVEQMNYEDFNWLMDINFWGVVYGTKAFLPHLKAQPQAHIVNISSVFGIIAVPSQSAYNASKFAVRGFTEALRMELLDTGVTVSCVHPGGIKTNIVRSSRFRNSFAGEDVSQEQTVKEFDTKMARTTPDQAAHIIIEGMRKQQPKILVGLDAQLIDVVQRTFPVGYQKLVAKGAKRRRK